MALPFLSGQPRRRDQIIAVDLGAHTSKAVHLSRKGESYTLMNFAVRELPQSTGEKGASPEAQAEELKALVAELGSPKCKHAAFALGVNEAILRHAELPMVGVADMRLMLRFNPKNYLLQDLPNHAFDCHILPPRGPLGEGGVKPGQKARVLVGGAKRAVLDEVQTAARSAGLQAVHVVPGLIGPLNAFELAEPQVFANEVVALVDLGFRGTTVSVLMNGELVLSRVVAIGGDRLTAGLSEALGTNYAEAESIKLGMLTEVQASLEPLLMPLGRELRASIDAFEHQNDKTVTQVFLSGAAATTELIVQALQAELMLPCKPWNPVSFMNASIPPQKMADYEKLAPRLAVAVGAGLAAL